MCAQVRDRWVREIQKKRGQADAKIKGTVSNSSNVKMSRRKNKRKPKEGRGASLRLCTRECVCARTPAHGGLELSVLIGPVQKRSWGTSSENNVRGSRGLVVQDTQRFPGTMLNLSPAHIRRKYRSLVWDKMLSTHTLIWDSCCI